jgi:hypothetical protein
VLGGLLASALFKRVWKLVSGEEVVPKPTDRHRGWLQTVLAVAFEGAVYSGVKALVQRGSAAGFEEATGQWPD